MPENSSKSHADSLKTQAQIAAANLLAELQKEGHEYCFDDTDKPKRVFVVRTLQGMAEGLITVGEPRLLTELQEITKYAREVYRPELLGLVAEAFRVGLCIQGNPLADPARGRSRSSSP